MGRTINMSDFISALITMKILFPDQDFTEGGAGYNKFEYLFNLLLKEECPEDEFNETMIKFGKVHTSTNWMPADLYGLHCRLHKPQFS